MDTPDAEPDIAEESAASSPEDGSFIEPTSLPTMLATEAIEILRRGELLERKRVVGLKLKGQFTKPVRLRCVTLIQPVIEKATFAEEVVFERRTLDRLRATRQSKFPKGIRREDLQSHEAGALRHDGEGRVPVRQRGVAAGSSWRREHGLKGVFASGKRSFRAGSSSSTANSSRRPIFVACTPNKGSSWPAADSTPTSSSAVRSSRRSGRPTHRASTRFSTSRNRSFTTSHTLKGSSKARSNASRSRTPWPIES